MVYLLNSILFKSQHDVCQFSCTVQTIHLLVVYCVEIQWASQKMYMAAAFYFILFYFKNYSTTPGEH